MNINLKEGKIGLIAGSFDLIHPGYIIMFSQAKEACDYLIIALQGDPTIERPNKCKPVQTIEDRKLILESIRYVDKVITYNTEKELYDLLDKTYHDIRILGEEYKEAAYTGHELGHCVLWLKRLHKYSTTALKEAVCAERCIEHNKCMV